MPLRVRLALLVAVAVAVLVAGGGLLFVHQLQTGLTTSLDATLRARADALVSRVGPEAGTEFQDAGLVGVLPPNEALAQVVDSRGVLMDSSEGTRGRSLLTQAQLTLARQGPLALTTDGVDGRVRLLAVPVPESGQPTMVVVVGTTYEVTAEAVKRVGTALIVGGPAAIALSTVMAWLLAGAALRPVERMRRQADLITAGHPDARLAVPATRDEVANLAATMNALLERHQRALEQQRDFVADAGHELRTPLTILRTELELAGHPSRTRQDLVQAVTQAAEDTDRLIRLAEDLLLLARADSPEVLVHRVPLRLDKVAEVAAGAAKARAGAAGVRLSLDLETPVTVDADHDRLRQVIDNLLDNALRFAPVASTITIRLFPAASAGNRAVLEIADQGPGFPPAFLPHAFERFRRADTARTAQEGGGTGLGLAIVAFLVHAHDGTVTADNVPGGGARIKIELPRTE